MATKQAKRHKRLKKPRKTGLPRGKSSQRGYKGPERSKLDLEQHLLSRPFVSKPVAELPASVDQIRVRMKRLPEDLKGIVHSDGRISIPLDAKHRASNWREVLEHLDRLEASQEEMDSLSEDIERRIIQRLKRAGRIVEASNRDEKDEPRTAASAAGIRFQELSASPEAAEALNAVPPIPEDITPIEVQGRTDSLKPKPIQGLSRRGNSLIWHVAFRVMLIRSVMLRHAGPGAKWSGLLLRLGPTAFANFAGIQLSTGIRTGPPDFTFTTFHISATMERTA